MTFLTEKQLERYNFGFLGENVKISDKASIYNAEKIHLDDNCRLDDFCILSAGKGGIHIGKYVHIASYSSLIGSETIYFSDFSGVSSRVSVYSSSDDFSGEFMPHPTIPEEYRKVYSAKVFFDKHTIVAAGCIVLPGAKLNIGVAIGAMSLVLGKEYKKFTVFVGIPAKPIKKRSKELLNFEEKLIEKYINGR